MNASTELMTESKVVRVLLFGAQAQELQPLVAEYPNLRVVNADPDVVACYGGDGTLLAAELEWPGVPKVPILNSRVGHRCIPHPPEQVIDALAKHALVVNKYGKIRCAIHRAGVAEPEHILTPLNEIILSKGRANSAVRYRIWINGDPYQDDQEIIGDGLVICTPFGSTAYFSKITRGVFTKGIGVAFVATPDQVNHLVIPSDSVVRVVITRGPAMLAYDCAPEHISLEEDDELVVHKHPDGATILTCAPVRRLSEPF